MGQDAEEIIIPTETQGLTTLRRRGLVIFFSVSIVLLGAAIITLALR